MIVDNMGCQRYLIASMKAVTFQSPRTDASCRAVNDGISPRTTFWRGKAFLVLNPEPSSNHLLFAQNIALKSWSVVGFCAGWNIEEEQGISERLPLFTVSQLAPAQT